MDIKSFTFNQLPLWTDDFFFFQPQGEELVICNPQTAVCHSPVFLRSRKTLEEHIQLVQDRKLKKATIVAEDIHFLVHCPSLEELSVIPSFDAHDFDFSPLYDMPNLHKLCCETSYGPYQDRVSDVDYSRIIGLTELSVSGPKGHKNVHLVKGLKSLYLGDKQPVGKTLVGAFDGTALEDLSCVSSTISTLEGIGDAKNLRKLLLAFNYRLRDISDLLSVKDSLTSLEIENCGKIKDFSVLAHLHKLEKLRLLGSNEIADFSFVQNMPNLQEFVCTMKSVSGDVSMCLPIPYVHIQNRRHYNYKDEDFQKGRC